MVLQKILFPNENICNEKELYFRSKQCTLTNDVKKELFSLIEKETKKENDISEALSNGAVSYNCKKTSELLNEITVFCDNKKEDAVIFTGKGHALSLDTYFNSFSIFKWKKYTNLDNLSLSLEITGHFEIEIKNVIRSNNDNVVTTLYKTEISTDRRKATVLNISFDDIFTGLVYVHMTSLSDIGILWGGSFNTNIEKNSDTLSPVKIAVDICTYKRERLIEHNISQLTDFLLDNKNSPLHGNLELYISDNGKTLDVDKLSNENVHIYPNKNLGGAGGFGRAMYEILKEKDKKGFTNIVMMDDDVKIDPNVFERLFAFLSLQKDEYKEAHIGGAMLELGNMWLQSESGDHWFPTGHKPVKYRYDLRILKWILKNEIEDSVDYFGWWFCCMPISVVRDNNLPLPIFIKRDDIEYGVRNGRDFINLNGLCVWHEAFDAKKTPFLDYYYYRNPPILNARHFPNFNVEDMLDFYDNLRPVIDNDVNYYRYKEAHIKLQGIDDFLKGIDWLKKQDSEELNNALIKRWSYSLQDIEEINVNFIHGVLEKNLGYKETKNDEERRYKTNNGWNVSPTKGTVLAPIKDAHPGLICGASRVIYYDEKSQKGYITYRSDTLRDAVYKHFEMTRKNIIKNYERVRKEYYERFNELTDVAFWEKYLFGESEIKEVPIQWWETLSDISENRKHSAKERLKQYLLEIKEQEKIVKNYPIVNNRVVFYLYSRRGFTCNLKYILLALTKIKEAKNKLEIIWVSDYPESCSKIEELGVKVIKAGTKEHWENYFTARVNITSDNQPPYFYKRTDQIAITAWHAGMNYKVIGYDCLGTSTDEELKLFTLSNKEPDYWLSGSRYFSEDTSKSFRHDEEKFIPIGMARNDIFFKDQTKLIKRIKNDLNITENKKLALYAPTFRRGKKGVPRLFNTAHFKKVLSEKWGGEWSILFRGHYFNNNNPNIDAIDVSQYEDMQELLLISDILVSDYSSCLWDYTFTGRPAFVFAPDLHDYIYSDRGLSLPLDKWPYPIATTSDELYENIINFDTEDYQEKVAIHHKMEGSFENGTSAFEACKLICKECGIDIK